MKLSSRDIDALVGVIDYYVPDLHAEIGRTAAGPVRQALRAEEANLLALRQRLLAARRDAREAESADDLGL